MAVSPVVTNASRGESVTIEDMATTTGKPVEEVKKVLQSLPSVEIDEQGRVVGLGLTLIPTLTTLRLMGSNYMPGAPLTHLYFQHSSVVRSTSSHPVTAPENLYG